MDYVQLGHSDLRVSRVCLGTMTFGVQNDEAEGHAQLDRAVERGVNFIDTAEMYPVPAGTDTQGATEAIVGTWLQNRERDQVVVATKVIGRSGLSWIRKGGGLNRDHIREAVEGSLRRLRTDYVDLYQVHWPDRYVNKFGERCYNVKRAGDGAPILETMRAMAELIAEGKIRHYGVSNETPYGIAEYLRLAERHDLPKPVSIQNAYNLLNRVYEIHLLEACHHAKIDLLAYSPLAFGLLTGKYRGGRQPASARLVRFPGYAVRYVDKPNAEAAIEAYSSLAGEHGLTRMALQFVKDRPFAALPIIGATSQDQLEQNLDALEGALPKPLARGIDEIHMRIPDPCP